VTAARAQPLKKVSLCEGRFRRTRSVHSTARFLLLGNFDMTVLPRDSDIVAVVVILGTVLITGLLRAF
jgi:hypothetical protein